MVQSCFTSPLSSALSLGKITSVSFSVLDIDVINLPDIIAVIIIIIIFIYLLLLLV